MVLLFQLLAGAQVNDLTTHKQTGLHLAASCDHAVIGSVLLQNGVDCNALDDNMCNGINPPYLKRLGFIKYFKQSNIFHLVPYSQMI